MFRLQQKSSGKFYVMGESSVVPMDRQSSLFNKQDEYLGSKSYSFEIPLEPNKAIIRNAHHINSSNAGRTDQVIVWDSYRPLQEAKMVFTIKGRMITGALYFDGSSVSAGLKNKKLIDVAAIDDDPIYFDNGAAMLAYMNSTVTGDQKTKKVIFFPVKNDNAYRDIPADQHSAYPDLSFPLNNYMNGWRVDVSTGAGTFMFDLNANNYKNSQMPYFKVVHIFKRILQYLGYRMGGTWKDEESANRIVMHTCIAIDSPFFIADFSYYAPDITIGAFIKEMRVRLGLSINFNDNTRVCEINTIKYILANGAIVDLRDKQLADSYEETGTAVDAFVITQAVDDKDKGYEGVDAATLPVLTIGDLSGAITIEDISLLSAATKMYDGIGPQGASWRVPDIQVPIYPKIPISEISAVDYKDRSNFKLRLLYYHGMVENSAGYLYPYASIDNFDRTGAKLTDFSLSLDLTGLTYSGMKELYTYIRNSKPFYMAFSMTVQQYFEMEASNRLLVTDPYDFSTVVCLFDVMSADLDNRNLVNVKITLYPDIQPDNILPPSAEPDAPVILPPVPPYDNGVVFVKLFIENITTVESSYPPPFYNRKNGDVVLKFYANAAGTIPKNVTDLTVGVRTRAGSGGNQTANYVNSYRCSTTTFEKIVEPNAAQSTNAGGTTSSWSYAIEPGAKYTAI